MSKKNTLWTAALAAILVLAGCASSAPSSPRLSALSASPGAENCAALVDRLSFPNTRITAVNDVPEGALRAGSAAVPRHCQVLGRMDERRSPVDGRDYAIAFELRLPLQWNGRFYYQGNGGTDGVVVPATGPVGGGGPVDNALRMGFAVLSSDGGHSGATDATFGIDPQARLDFGYEAIQKLTPLAKAFIRSTYGRGPDRSYFGGCSNGGRLSLVAATRLAGEYDGFLVGDPQFHLPLSAINHLVAAQVFTSLATTQSDIATGFTAAERAMVSKAVLARCDALDGAVDGMVQDSAACQHAFDLQRDVPTCAGARDGTCLSAQQKTKIAAYFRGATDGKGARFYASFPWDAGIAGAGWAGTLFANGLQRSPGALAFLWEVPPQDPAAFDAGAFALGADVETMLARVRATDGRYRESATSFTMPPHEDDLGTVRNRGGKIIVYHGTSDSSASSDDTLAWYRRVDARNQGAASNFARLFLVPGMNHCQGGPAADQFDLLTPLVRWVEDGAAPERVVATVRGPGNAGGANPDVPAGWAADRSRPLCAWPKAARYQGSGSPERAENFACR